MATEQTQKLALGSFIRMRALKPHELPSHPTLEPLQTKGSPPGLKPFISTVLDEGHGFITNYLPKTFKVKAASKPSPPSSAPVELLNHEISAHDIPEEGRTMGASETWFARTSIHENAAKAGTASFEEFDGGLRKDHSLNEKNYTPEILDAHRILDWTVEDRQVEDWKEVDIYLMEMLHKIPFPLNKRVFTVLVISARKEDEFLDVQIPVDVTKIEGAKYAKDSNIVNGMYCSVERGDLVEGGSKVRWQMGTASNAKGALPMWMQKMGVPGAVVKDVGLFIDWCDKKRSGKA